LKVPQRREILCYHVELATVDMDGVSNPIYKLSLAETGIALQRLMPQLPTNQSNDGSIELNGDGESAVGMDVVEERMVLKLLQGWLWEHIWDLLY
jgi:hypothetical protein